jgi:hypothetical protein
MVHYTLILEGKYRLSIGRLSFPHTCDRAQQKLKSDILVYSNMLFTQTFSNWKLIWTTLPENTKTIGLQILKVQNCFIDNNDKNPKEAIQ